ncbi:hypothetical protein Cgig2_032049 [Carnegiea gigantea]|uniref:Uncharacterized protein n=1 Tax=Carnegiea gigantea TaxID=171969 RepID=A0A9Q1K5K7_9CARY|nr:hypothetical protein Cgig2_032049 [Carnegiea gigantea]
MKEIAQSSLLITIKHSLYPPIFPTHQIQIKTHLQKPIISAKWGKRRYGSQRFGSAVDLVAMAVAALGEEETREKDLAVDRGKQSGSFFWALLVVCVFAVCCLEMGWKRKIKDWVLGFRCGAALMGLGWRNNQNFVRWVDGFGSNNLPNFVIIPKSSKKGRRWI